jgi:2-dehydro-3-deoxy-D-gluconate 5-dehydrogenase
MSASKAFDLDGRVAIVTGGNGGIGLGMATGLAQAGAALLIAGRNTAKNAAAVKTLQALGANAAALEADVTGQAACRALVAAALDRFGRLDILVNNAGTNIRKQPQDYTAEEWKSVLDTNLTSAFLCSQAAYPAMLKAGGGKIINIGSMLSIFGARFAGPYGASKGGMVQLTKSLASAWAKDHIQVNAVLPGWIDTDLTRQARKDIPGLHESVLARTPAGRWGEPSDFAGIAVFLASSAANFITGATIAVDGGYSSQG